MNMLTPTVILCDLPNLQRQDFIKGGKDFEGNLRLVNCLDILCEHLETALGLDMSSKWLFGDIHMYDYNHLLRTFQKQGWRYIACPAEEVRVRGRGSLFVSTSDAVLKGVFNTFMRYMPGCTSYVFISDDTDFMPEVEACLAHGYDVTLLISGRSSHPQAYKAKKKGATVVRMLDVLATAGFKIKTQAKEIGQPEEGSVEESSPESLPSPEWMREKEPQSPLERFNRRYGTKRQ